MTRRVLLVEDNYDTAESLMAACELRGIEVTLARSVEAAIAAYMPDEFDVIVLDYELPDGTGIDVLERVFVTDRAVTVMHSGLDRTKELMAAGRSVDHQISKSDPFALMDILEGK